MGLRGPEAKTELVEKADYIEPPEYFGDAEKKHWDKLVYELIDNGDNPADFSIEIELECVNFVLWRGLREKVAKDGTKLVTNRGAFIKNPDLSAMKEIGVTLLAIGKERRMKKGDNAKSKKRKPVNGLRGFSKK